MMERFRVSCKAKPPENGDLISYRSLSQMFEKLSRDQNSSNESDYFRRFSMLKASLLFEGSVSGTS